APEHVRGLTHASGAVAGDVVERQEDRLVLALVGGHGAVMERTRPTGSRPYTPGGWKPPAPSVPVPEDTKADSKSALRRGAWGAPAPRASGGGVGEGQEADEAGLLDGAGDHALLAGGGAVAFAAVDLAVGRHHAAQGLDILVVDV